MHRLQLECLETRYTPSAILGSDGVLYVHPNKDAGHYTYGVVVVQHNDEVIVRERLKGHGTTYTRIPLLSVLSMEIRGQRTDRNVLENRTNIPATFFGGDRVDSVTCGSGYNIVYTGYEVDKVVSVRGGQTIKPLRINDHDIIYTHRNFGSVQPGPLDLVIYT